MRSKDDPQSGTVAAQVERCSLGTQTRSRGLASSDETDRASRSTVAQHPDEQACQGGLPSRIALENSRCSQSDVEDAHESAATNEQRTTTDVFAGYQRAGDRDDEKDEGDNSDEEGILHAGDLEEVLDQTVSWRSSRFRNNRAYGGVAEDDRSTSGPLRADTDSTSNCSSPVVAAEDVQERRLLRSQNKSFLGLNTVLDDTILVFDVVSRNVAVQLLHRLLRAFRVALSCVVERRLGNEPNHQDQDLQIVCQYTTKLIKGRTNHTPVNTNSVAIRGLQAFGL